MAFDSSNLVAVGDRTLKSQYDQVLDNSNYLLTDVLQIAADNTVRLGATATPVQIDKSGIYGAMTFETGGLLYADTGVRLSSAGTLSLVPNTGTIAGGQNGVQVNNGSVIDLLNTAGSSSRIRFWDAVSAYHTRFQFTGTEFKQFYSNGSEFIDANSTGEIFDVRSNDANPHYMRVDPGGREFGLVSYESGNIAKVDFNFSSGVNTYTFRGDTIDGGRSYTEFSLDGECKLKMYARSRPTLPAATIKNPVWSIGVNANGILDVLSSDLSATSSLKMNVSAAIKPQSIAASNTAAILAISANYTAAQYEGFIFYSSTLNRLIFSDGTTYRVLDSTAI